MSSTLRQPETSSPGGSTAPDDGAGGRDRFRLLKSGTAPIALTLVLLLVAMFFLNSNLLEPTPLLNIVRRATPLMVLAMGQLFVIVSGGFDLSVGSLMTVTVILAAGFGQGDEAATYPVLALVFGVGALVGLVNGLVTTKLKVPSFITTLGMLLILEGAAYYFTGGAPRGALAENFRMFGRQEIELPGFDLPYAVLVLLVIGTVAWRLLHRSTLGQQLYATGGGVRAAELSGVSVDRVRIIAFVLSSTSAVAAGVLIGGIAGVSANVGAGYEFQAISAVVLGGAVLGGGKGSMTAVILGALVLEVLFTLLNLLGLPQPLRETAQGLIIIGAVGFAAYRSRKSG